MFFQICFFFWWWWRNVSRRPLLQLSGIIAESNNLLVRLRVLAYFLGCSQSVPQSLQSMPARCTLDVHFRQSRGGANRYCSCRGVLHFPSSRAGVFHIAMNACEASQTLQRSEKILKTSHFRVHPRILPNLQAQSFQAHSSS